MKKIYLLLVLSIITAIIYFPLSSLSSIHRAFSNERNNYSSEQTNANKSDSVSINNKIGNKNSDEVDQYLQQIHFNGVVLVKKRGTTILMKGYGYRDLENNLPNTTGTYYPIGSISKFFVSTSLMQLHERGLISFNDPISKYIPNFPNGSKLTLFHLISHTSGIKAQKELNKTVSSTDLMNKIVKTNRHYKPVFKWDYNDTNYMILAYVVEKVSGMSYGEYVNKHIFEHGNINEIGQGNNFYKNENIAKGYHLIQYTIATNPLRIPNFSYLLGCGDIYSTVTGIQKMDEAIISNKLFSKTSFSQFAKPYQHHYAYGFYNEGKYLYNHGVVPGIDCMNVFDPVSKTYVVVFTNSQKMQPTTFDIAMKLLKTVNN
ncbi:serine hydrolase domain-containing protein [Gottfriedia luciferensis]|uniref:serine hydrolase domain-containing protein n=1 Tax=Gottfriedia luciferensis TaxID=178774 RepID=UPI001F2A0235|nr:serine hydrolase domain-containing protein [Gottfriedia luciferensis]